METASILILDDEPHIRHYLAETLSRQGYRVVSAATGTQALELIETQEFDLALLDLMLPDISGIEVFSTLRQRWPDTTVIILTAHGSMQTAIDALRLGAFDYLLKPIKGAILRRRVAEGLQKRFTELQKKRLLTRLEQQILAQLQTIRETLLDPGQADLPTETLPRQAPTAESSPTGEKNFGRWRVDMIRHLIFLDGTPLEFSPTEFDILLYLLDNAPRVVSPVELVEAVQGYTPEAWEARDIIRQHIYNIRQKIKDIAGDEGGLIRTVRGVGYTVEM
ncbi:MAG: DNA-binding response regulator [Chloroflexi bacterium]|nr:MAG: DNA-binding response regulator [Chloroflexota bacterium]